MCFYVPSVILLILFEFVIFHNFLLRLLIKYRTYRHQKVHSNKQCNFSYQYLVDTYRTNKRKKLTGPVALEEEFLIL